MYSLCIPLRTYIFRIEITFSELLVGQKKTLKKSNYPICVRKPKIIHSSFIILYYLKLFGGVFNQEVCFLPEMYTRVVIF